MYLLVDVLEQTEYLPGILEAFVEIGVTGTTALDSIGMGRILVESGSDATVGEVVTSVLERGKPTNRTIFAVIKDKGTLDRAIDVIRRFCGDLNDPGKGILFTLPLEYVDGLAAAV